MPLCPSCGNEYQKGSRFCPSCGRRIKGRPAASIEPLQNTIEENIIWEGKPARLKARMKGADRAHPHKRPGAYSRAERSRIRS